MRLLHFADLHLGIENYGRIDPKTGLHSRLADFAASFRFVVDLAISERVDAVLFSGDAYKTPSPSPTWQREFAAQIHRLDEASIPLVLTVGNHDAPASFGRATSVDIFSALKVGNTHVIRTPRLFELETASGPIQIAGLPWPTRHFLRADERYRECDSSSLTERIQEMCSRQISEFADNVERSRPAVLVAHVTASEAIYSGSERTALIGVDPVLKTGTLANPAFDYVALGHVHRHQDLNPERRPPVVYSGSIDRIDFGEEREEKGCCLVSIENSASANRRTNYEFIPTPARRFVTIDVPASDADPTTAVLNALADTAITDAVVRILYTVSAEDSKGDNLDSQRILAAMHTAYHVSGIFPQTQAPRRLRRAAVNEEMGLAEALDRYVDNAPELHGLRQELQRYAAHLAQKLEMGESPEDG